MTTLLGDVQIAFVWQFLGMLAVPRFVFPFVFMEAVSSAYVEQLFYFNVQKNRSHRVAMTLRANCITAVISSLAGFAFERLEPTLSRSSVTRFLPRLDALGFIFWQLIWLCLFVVPVLIKAHCWRRWSGRKLLERILVAYFVAGVFMILMVWSIRWLREHLPHSLEWRLRTFDWNNSWYMDPLSWSCFAILIMAWLWPLPKQGISVMAAAENSPVRSQSELINQNV